MGVYKCLRCGKEFDELLDGPVRCPFCSYRAVEKTRPEVIKEVLAE